MKKMQKISILGLSSLVAGAGMLGTAYAASSVLAISPRSQSYTLNSTFALDVTEDSAATPVNAVQVNLNYPADRLQFEGIDTSGSGFNVKAESTGANGVIHIALGKTGAPDTGSQRVARISFKGLSAGSAPLTLAAGSAVVSSTDNTDILAGHVGDQMAVVNIAAPNVGSGSGNATPKPSPSSKPSASPSPSASATPAPSASPTTKVLGLATLPDTGAAALVGGALGLGALAYFVLVWSRGRKGLQGALKRK